MMRSFLKVLAVSALLLGLASCGGGNGGEESGFARSKTLYLAGSQWGDPSTFNPLAEAWQSAWPVRDRFNLMYEPLINYNPLTGDLEPLLGTLVSSDPDKIVVDINPKAKWSDGQPVTSADVKFVFEIGHRFKNAATAFAIDFTKEILVEKLESGVERLTFIVHKEGRNNSLMILDHLQSIRIAPSHVFEKLLADNGNDLSAVQRLKIDKDPVITGPYNLLNYTNERIVLKRRDDYWANEALYGGKLPAPEFIIHPIYKSNDHFAIGLQQGKLDASQTFMPRIWLKKSQGVQTWYDEAPYYVPGTMPLLVVNTTRAPLNDKNFRRAMAAAINYGDIKELAVSNYATDLQPGLIMNQGLEKKFFSGEDALEHGVKFDAEYAKQILADAGYKSVFKADGTLDYMTDKDGNRLPTLSIMVPAGWSDWEAMVKIAEKSLRSVGIDVRESPVDASIYWSSHTPGDFDLVMRKLAEDVTPALPWRRFDAVMSSRNWAPVGGDSRMNENQGRYNQPGVPGYRGAVDSLLKVIPTITDEAEVVAAYRELNKIFMQDQPVIPLCYLPEQFYQFSNRYWKNWPTTSNPYAPPLLPWVGASTKILWNLQLAK